MNALARIFSDLVGRATEGAYRPGPYYLPITGGWLSAKAGSYMNWWQLGYDPTGRSSQSAMVEACISAYAQTVAMLPGDQWRGNNKGGRDRVSNTSLSRVLRHPNEYQSISDFMLNLTRSLYLTGNAYALALRNSRNEINELHLMDPNQSRPEVAVTGDVFYRLKGNDVIDRQVQGEQLIVPMRDVLHVKLHCIDRKRPFPLIGETPLTAALANIATSDAMTAQQIEFYQNQARPSAVLSTELPLDRETVQHLRDRWNEMSKGLDGCGPGGTPILTHGLKVQPWAQVGKDTQIAEVMKINDEKIALAFRIPLQVLGVGGTPYASTELLMQQWVSTGLGFALNHIEMAFDLLFELKGEPDEYVEFNTAALLRSATKDRIEALVRGVQGGVYSPNEARNLEGLDSVEAGDEPRVQAQVVPLSAAEAIPSSPASPASPATQPPADDKKPPKEPKDPAKNVRRPILHQIANDYGRRLRRAECA